MQGLDLFNTHISTLVVSSEKNDFDRSLLSFLQQIEYIGLSDGLEYAILHKPSIIFFDNIPAEEILKFRHKNYQTRFIVYYSSDTCDQEKLLPCHITKILLKTCTAESLSQAFMEAKTELENLQETFLLQLGNNYAWQRSRRILYDTHFSQVELSKNESLLLEIFVENANHTLSCEHILNHFDTLNASISVRTLRNLVTSLRKKVSKELIQNIYGDGYRFIIQPSKNHLTLENFNRLANILASEENRNEMQQKFCDELLMLYNTDRSFTMYIDFENGCIKVPCEASVAKYPGAYKKGIDIPLIKEQFDAFDIITSVSDPVILGENFLKKAERSDPETWSHMLMPRSALIYYFMVNDVMWMAGLHQCSYERRWSQEEVIFLKHAVHNLRNRMIALMQ